MTPASPWKYYVAWVRLHQQDGFLLWVARTESEALWTDPTGRVPSFGSLAELRALTDSLGVGLNAPPPAPIDFDPVLAWLANPTKQVPANACLSAWNLFDDLASGTGAAFWGRRRGPVHNRVYDKLFYGSGLWGVDAQGHARLRGEGVPMKTWTPTCRSTRRNVLRRVLRQGFRLWQKYVYAAPNPAA